jgi:hypothetical protein
MLLSEYQARLAELLGYYARTDLIVSSELSADARTQKIGVIRGSVTFFDGSQLFFSEYIDVRYRLEKLTYAYHFQDANGILIFRYDNAAHKPALTYSCHKHLPDNLTIESAAPDFSELIDEIMERFIH